MLTERRSESVLSFSAWKTAETARTVELGGVQAVEHTLAQRPSNRREFIQIGHLQPGLGEGCG